MSLTKRTYQNNDDYWRIREFLREIFLINQRREHSWQAYRFDYWRWHGIENLGDGRLEEDVFFWETAGGHIAAVLNRESAGQAYFQVHPDRCTPEVETEMLTVAEEHLAIPGRDGRRILTVWADQHDRQRQQLLRQRGYSKGDWPEYQRRRPLSGSIPDLNIAPGYTVRALGEDAELPARAYTSWKAFQTDDQEEPFDHDGWSFYRNIQRAPLYRRDLDIVAVAPDGEMASFCTVWFDDVTRTGAFEPVGTVAAHRRRGLGKAVLLEGLRRLQWMGATLATVGSYDTAAHALYASAGFTGYELSERWSRTL